MIKIKGIKFTDSQILLLLLLQIYKNEFISHDLVSRILRRHVSAISRDYDHFRKHKITNFNFQHSYKISKKGLDLIDSLKICVSIYDELCDFVKELNDHPEEPGWKPKKSDNLTNLQHQIFYLFEKGISLNNAKIAEILTKHQESTIRAIKPLLKEGLLKKNPFTCKYSLTPNGNELIKNNVSTDILCKIVQNFGKNLKKRPGINYSIIIAGLGYAGLEISKSAYASSTTSITSTSVQSLSTTNFVASTTGTTTTSILTTKTALASILATIIVTGGIAGPYALDPNMFGNSIPDYINTANENIGSSIPSKAADSVISSQYLDTGTSKSAKSSVPSNTPSSTTTTSSPQSQENSLENIQNNDSQTTDSSSGSSSSSSSSTTTTPSITPLSQFAKTAISTSTTDIKVDKSDNMWVADKDNNQVRKLNPQGETVLVIGDTTQKDTIIPTTSHFDTLSQNISLLVMPYAYATDDSNTITLNKPTRIAIDNSPAGDTVHVYIMDSGNKRILKVDQDGNHIPEFRFDCNGTGSTQNQLCANYNDSEIFDLNIVTSTDGKYLYVTTGNTNSNAKGLSLNFHALNSVTGSLAESENSNLNLTNAVTRDNYIYALDDVVGAIIKFNSDEIIDIPLKDSENDPILPFSFTVDKSEEFIYVFDLFGTLYQYDIDGELVDSQKYDGFITGMDIDSDGNILALDVINEQITTISFDDAITIFSAKFDEIMCDTNSMINDPVDVPPQVTAALPISELLPRANSLAFETQQYEESLLFYYITSQIQPSNVNAWNGIGYTQTQICSNDSAEIAYNQALSIDSNNINAKIGLADFTINQITREGNASILKLEDAELQLQSVLDLDSTNTNAFNALGYIETLREDYSEAIDYYEQSLKIDNKKTTTLNGLAFAHLRSDNLGEATTTYIKVLNVDPNNFNALVGLITSYTQQGFPELAEQFIDDLDKSNSIIADKLIEQGNWLQQNGQTQEAQRLFDAAEKL